MTKFAFYGRVSTEDQQDPVSSRSWQMRRAQQLIEPHAGAVVAEFFDIGLSRSLPWKRRPEAARLLAELARPDRGFSAVVIGEPARAFYGQQFGLTFPVFTHYGVELWVPEVGGCVDPGSDAHEIVMSLYGGMSKGERNRIKIRVRTAMAAQASTEGRFLGGRPPYGYNLVDIGPHPNPARAAEGLRQRKLEPNPITAPIVRRIFDTYLSGKGLMAIAESLNRDGIPSPAAADPERNRHRAGNGGAWGRNAVRTILRNPRYLGHQVWNRQRRDEVLLNVDDVALGHETRMRLNDRSDWVWSAELVHEPIVDADVFARAQEIAAASAHRPNVTKGHRSKRHYVLSGRIRCSLCGRRMQGSFNNGKNQYRCHYGAEYKAQKQIDHPTTLYLREERILPALDAWLMQMFDPANIDTTCEALAMASELDEAGDALADAARLKLADCDDRLRKYRAALDSGADPATVSAWMAEVQGERLAAERQLAGGSHDAQPMTKDEVRALVGDVKRALRKLAKADPELRAEVYAEMGIELTYQPDKGTVLVEALPACTTARFGWPNETMTTCTPLRGELVPAA